MGVTYYGISVHVAVSYDKSQQQGERSCFVAYLLALHKLETLNAFCVEAMKRSCIAFHCLPLVEGERRQLQPQAF